MAARIIEQLIEIPAEHERNIFGQFDEHIKKIERTLQVTLISRDGILKIVGPAPNVQKAERSSGNCWGFLSEEIPFRVRMWIMHCH